MDELLAQLNPEQRKAVKVTKGPILILAGAGSGKTRVITYRIAYLIKSKNINPKNILAITFTNKAAGEMQSRIQTLLGSDHKVWIRTFHSTCAKMLRGGAERIGIKKNFAIYDEYDQLSVIKECLSDLDIDAKAFSPAYIAAVINNIKENLSSGSAIESDILRNVYNVYNKKLAEYNALDFDDLIMKVVELFKTDEDILEYYQEKFRYILVDEYQDTNRAQYVLTKMLAEKHRNLCVVGDDDQSIYSWRGAEIRNILDFEEDFPDTTVIKLQQNYRSTRRILKAASAVVSNNEYRKSKTLWCDNETGERIVFFDADDSYTEAAYVARKIMELKLKGVNLGEIAVFYRVNYQSRLFEECFITYRIPYEVVGSLRFYERAEIKNVLAYLRVINNPLDAVSLRRIINVPSRKIGHETMEKISAYGEKHRISVYEVLHEVDNIKKINSGTRKRIKNFAKMIDLLIDTQRQMDIYELALQVVKDSGYLSSLSEDRTERDYIRRKNVEELMLSMKDYARERPEANLNDYLEEVSLRSDIDDWNESTERVNLMTLHNAKGLEFDIVFITGFEDGLIPHYKSQQDAKQYEEERRLLYVGITRARKLLHMTYARQRDMFRAGPSYTELSPFYHEIPRDVMCSGYNID
ncbi:MAG: UvrD-helicase domain-containing protein [candidate division WOR-3 bacterium]|nr:MAG: UvrD-helicase domain-containing protein [candidate division WOR-3 bacterium]